MNEFFNRVMTSARWFLGFIIAIGLISMLIWRGVDPVSYTETVNGFLKDVWEMMKFFIALCMIILGLRYIMRGTIGGGGKRH